MRKIFSYVVTLITLTLAVVFCVPSVMENTKFSMEYTGGFESVYKITSKTKDVSDNKVAKALGDGMSKLLSINNVKKSVITVESGNYIRANITSNNQLVSDKAKNAIQNPESYEITFRNAKDELLATGDEILKNIGAEYKGETTPYGQPIIYLNIKDTELLKEITGEIVAQTEGDKNLVIWIGFSEGTDSYEKIKTDTSVASKVIYNATVSEELEEEVITVTGNYTEDVAKNTVNLVNSGTYKYDLEVIQQKTITPETALRNRNLILISLGVVCALVIVCMAISFKLEGLFSIPALLLNEFFMIFGFTKLAGVITPQVIGAFILANVVMFTLYYLVLNRYKKTLKVNKSPIKSYKETFKKNTPIILDTTITMLIFSLITYFFGNGSENFAIYLSVSAVMIFASLLLFERFSMYLTCDIFNKNDKTVILSASKVQDAIASENGTVNNIDDYVKPIGIGFASLAGVGIIVSLILALVIKAPFNFYDDASKSSSLEIITNENKLETENKVMEFFGKEGLDIELTQIKLTKVDDKYHIFVTTDDTFSKYETNLQKELVALYGENSAAIENYVYYINDYNPTSVWINFSTIMYTTTISLLVTAIYFAIRYKWSYSIAAITTTLMTTVSLMAFFAITRIPVNSQTVVAISIVNALSIMTLVPFFSKIKELMKEYKKKYLSYEERVASFKRGRDIILLPTVMTVGIFGLISFVVMFFDLTNFSMYLAFILGSLFALIYNMTIVPAVWLLFENHRDKKKKIFKVKNISKSKYRKLDEQVFIGVND